MFDALGDKGNKPKASMAFFCNPNVSSIIIALSALAELADAWGPGDRWALLDATGAVRWNDPDLRREARRQVLQLHTGWGSGMYASVSGRNVFRADIYDAHSGPHHDACIYCWDPQEWWISSSFDCACRRTRS